MVVGVIYLLMLAATTFFPTINPAKNNADSTLGECTPLGTYKSLDLPNRFAIYVESSTCSPLRKHRYRFAISANPNLHDLLDPKSTQIIVDGYINIDKAETNYNYSVSFEPENKITISLPQNFVFLTTNKSVNGIEFNILRNQ